MREVWQAFIVPLLESSDGGQDKSIMIALERQMKYVVQQNDYV